MTDTKQKDWKAALAKSSEYQDKANADRTKSSRFLWDGAQGAINAWKPDTDKNAEALYGDVLGALGKSRKGDASKIKTVALAVRNNGLVLSTFPNLAKAYAEAKRLTTTAKAQEAEDKAITAATQALAESAPKSASTPENAAKIVMAEGPVKAAAMLLDALGVDAHEAHRAFIRALAQEAAGRVKPKAKAPKAGPKSGAKQATKAAPATAKKAAAKKVAAKKPAAKVAAPATAPTSKAPTAKAETKKAKKSKAPKVAAPPVAAPKAAPSAASAAAAGAKVPVTL